MAQAYLVLGAGPVGRAVATALLEQGAEVRLASRSGRAGPDGATPLSLDAADTAAVTAAAQGAEAVFNCLNPPHYHRWAKEWPPMARAALAAARDVGAVLATTSNLYPYGNVTGPITADSPEAPEGTKGRVRAAMWAQARVAHERGEVRAVEVRSGDYLGLGAFSILDPALRRARTGRTAWVIGALDQPHAWAYVGDVARTLVAAAAEPSAWGRLWLTPSASNATASEVVRDVAQATGRGGVAVRRVPGFALGVAGLVVPLVRELRETACERDRPFVVDAHETTERLGVVPTAWSEVVAELARQ